MTQQDKDLLLLRDLCARLPYGVCVYANGMGCYKLSSIELYKGNVIIEINEEKLSYRLYEIKPYLRSMSSMTEEEKREFSIFIGRTAIYTQQVCLDSDSMCNPTIGGYKCVYLGLFDKCIDYLNAHHFDYRGLIEKGLALEAPKDIYIIKSKY